MRVPAPPPELAAGPRGIAELARRVLHGLFLHHTFDHAATMAFYFFLGTIPLMVVVGLLVGQVVERDGLSVVTAQLYEVLPGVTGQLIAKELRDIAEAQATSVAPLSVLGFLWLTSNGFHNLMDVFELLIGAPRRRWLRQRLIAVIWVMATLTASCACVWFLLVTTGWTEGLDENSSMPTIVRRLRDALAEGWQRAGVLLVFGAVTTLGLAVFYRFAVAHPRGVRRRVWAGTLVAMVLWGLITYAFSAYVATIAHYSIYYGSLATVAITLLWFYLTSLALLIGAELNAQLEGVRDIPPTTAL